MEGCQSRDSQTRWSLSLVIPAYNEAAGIRQAILEADEALAELAQDYEILIVDDGSQDDTAIVVRQAASGNDRVRLLRHDVNQGYGAALRTGFEAARFDRVAFTDADCQFHLADLASLVPLTDKCHLAVGYRADRQDPWRRRFYSWGYNVLVRALFDTHVRDCDCALKVFRKDAVLNLLPRTNGFFVNAEMLTRARRLGYQLAEAPVRHRPRTRGTSKVTLGDIPRTLRTLVPFWWSTVLFPRADSPEVPAPSASKESASPANAQSLGYLLTLIITAALLFFSRLGSPLQEPEEPRYAEIPRQMLESGSFAVPVLHGQPYYDKPPLLYWLVMGSYKVFGVQDWAARLVSSGAAFLCVLLAYGWGRRVMSARAAFLAALMLCLSARFVYLGRMLTMNSLLCLWVVAALAAAHLALSGSRLRWRWWLLSAVACALGLLTKGPIALVLTVVPVVAYQALDARAVRVCRRAGFVYLAIALGLAAPWFVTIAVSDPGFVGYFFWKHNFLRFAVPFDHAKPAWFYLPELLLGMLPWSLLLIPFVRLFRRAPTAAENRLPAALGFFLIAFAWSLVFYSVAGSKRAGYILPAMPPLALALGWYLDMALAHLAELGENAARLLPGSLFARRAAAVALAGGVAGSWLAAREGILRPGVAACAAGLCILMLAWVYTRRRLHHPARAWAICGTVTFAMLLASIHLAYPGYARRFSMRGQARQFQVLAADARVPVVCYPRGWDSVSFYLRRNDVRVYTPDERRQLIVQLRANPRTLAFIKSDHSLRELLRDLPASLEFVPRGRQGYVVVGWVQPRLEVPPTLYATTLRP